MTNLRCPTHRYVDVCEIKYERFANALRSSCCSGSPSCWCLAACRSWMLSRKQQVNRGLVPGARRLSQHHHSTTTSSARRSPPNIRHTFRRSPSSLWRPRTHHYYLLYQTWPLEPTAQMVSSLGPQMHKAEVHRFSTSQYISRPQPHRLHHPLALEERVARSRIIRLTRIFPSYIRPWMPRVIARVARAH